jgi:hypothetical protein
VQPALIFLFMLVLAVGLFMYGATRSIHDHRRLGLTACAAALAMVAFLVWLGTFTVGVLLLPLLVVMSLWGAGLAVSARRGDSGR